MAEFSIHVSPVNSDLVVLRPNGSLDSGSTPALEARIDAAVLNEQFHVVVDLVNTDFVSSAGLGLLLGTVALLRERDGDLILMNIPEAVRDTFELMSVADYFRVVENIDELEAKAK